MATTAPSTVFVLEDDPDTQEAYRDMIEAAGFRVVVASGGQEAVELLEAGLRPDAILMDIMMPHGDGFAFRAWQRGRPEVAAIPIVLATAVSISDEELAQIAPERYLVKPFSFRELTDALRAVAG